MSSQAFSRDIAQRIQAERKELAVRWLARLRSLVPVAENDIFPSDDVLDHVPVLIEQIGKFIAAPDDDIAANGFVIAKARELGNLRHDQRASVHQLLKEYELLRNVLETFTLEQAEALHLTSDPASVIRCLRRINLAVATLTQATVDTFIERYTRTIREQNRKLAAFNHMVSHELRQPLSALHMAAKLLPQVMGGDTTRRDRVINSIDRNVSRLVDLVATITSVSALRASSEDQPGVQHISLATVAAQAARQLREPAEARGVEIRLGPGMPDLEGDVGHLELILTNLISNAIKYSDPNKADRFVAVSMTEVTDTDCTFRVADNGIGMDATQLRSAFRPLFRAHASRDQELQADGLGLGLAIVQNCVGALDGTITAESEPGAGTTFTVRLPLRYAM